MKYIILSIVLFASCSKSSKDTIIIPANDVFKEQCSKSGIELDKAYIVSQFPNGTPSDCITFNSDSSITEYNTHDTIRYRAYFSYCEGFSASILLNGAEMKIKVSDTSYWNDHSRYHPFYNHSYPHYVYDTITVGTFLTGDIVVANGNKATFGCLMNYYSLIPYLFLK